MEEENDIATKLHNQIKTETRHFHDCTSTKLILRKGEILAVQLMEGSEWLS